MPSHHVDIPRGPSTRYQVLRNAARSAGTVLTGQLASEGYRMAGRAARAAGQRIRDYVGSRTRSGPPHLGATRSERAWGDGMQKNFAHKGPKVSSKVKGRKRVKVTRKFSKKVKQVLERVSPNGLLKESFLYRYSPLDDQQLVVDLGRGWDALNGNFTDSSRLHFFDPVRVLDAASVLFNAKGYNGNKAGVNTGQFDAKTVQVDVVRQWVSFEIKNNTARRMTIKLWSWKYKGNLRGTADFTGYWDTALNEEGAVATDGRINCYDVDKEMIGLSPKLSPRMSAMYQMEEKVIHLEAGKTTYHAIQGYRGVYDFSKFWDGVNFNNYQKNNMGVCMGFYPDIVATDTGGNSTATRSTDIVLADPYGILVETTCHYVIRMPEQAGFKITAAAVGTAQPLKQRRHHPYAIKYNPGPVGVIGNVAVIDDENPQAEATDGV